MANNEITFNELLRKLFNLLLILKKNFILLAVFIILFAGIGVFTREEKVFTATSSIMLKSDKLSGGGLLSLASQFGMGNDEVITFSKFQSIANSQLIVRRVLLKNVKVNGKKDLLGHHLLSESKLRDKWKENRKNLANVDLNKEGPDRDTVMSIITSSIKEWVTISEEKGKLTYVSVTSKNEDLAYTLCDNIVKETIDFFTKSAVENDIRTKEIIETKLDSIQNKLYSDEKTYSDLKDHSFQTVKTKGLVELMRYERNIRILNEMFIETTKQNEIIGFKILNNNPSIHVVDSPIYPLEFKRQSLIVRAIIFSVIGFFIGSTIIFGIIFYKKIKSNLDL